ncbi:hypothetical protein ACVIGA_006325 [Bradyrhizobium sp. USDA 3240]
MSGIPSSPVIARFNRAIQYAAAHRLKNDRLWNTGSPVEPGDDSVLRGNDDGGWTTAVTALSAVIIREGMRG